MPGPVAAYVARRTGTDPGRVSRRFAQQALAALERIAVPESRYGSGGYGRAGSRMLLPWLDKTNIHRASPAALECAFAAMRNHYIVKPALLQKLFAVSSLDLQAHPADENRPADENAAEFALYQFGRLLTVRDIVLETLFPSMVLGRVVCELVWDAEPWRRGRWKGRRLYRALKAKAAAKPVYDDFRNIIGVEGPDENGETKRYDPAGFLILRNLPWFGDDGTSDFLAIYQPLCEMEVFNTFRNIHLDKFTSPLVVVRTGVDGQPVTIRDPDTNREVPIQDVLEPAIQELKSRGYLIPPPGVIVEALQLAQRGEAEFQQAISDREQKIVLGIAGAFLQTLTAPGGSGDMRGDSATQASTAQLFVWDAAASICTELNRQAVPPLIDENYGDVADYPTLTLSGINLGEMNQMADIYGKAVVAGVKPSRRAYAKATGVQLATTPDDELAAPGAAGTPVATPGGGSVNLPFRFADAADTEKKKLTLAVPTRYNAASTQRPADPGRT